MNANPDGIESADFNNDGNLDLIIGLGSGAKPVIKFGDGNGSFDSTLTLDTAASTNTVKISDLNNDGNQDVIVGGAIHGFVVFENNGDGTFTEKISASFLPSTNTYDLDTGDFNQDGITDFIGSHAGGVDLFFGKADGTLETAVRINDQATSSTTSAQSIDLNEDGFLDIVIGDTDSDSISIYFGNGDGSFKDVINNSASDASDLAFADFNGDGAIDIAAGQYNPTDELGIFFSEAENTAHVRFINLRTQSSSRNELDYLDNLLENISKGKAVVGAAQNRLQIGINSLSSARENFAAAASQILDSDIAKETANATRESILQRTTAAVLAQANQQPAIALSLL